VNVLEALHSRRSLVVFDAVEVPADKELLRLVEAAATAPDHGRLRPWRLLVHRGRGREELGAALAEGSENPERERAKPLRAPMLVSIVFQPAEKAKIPRWEQLAGVSAMVYGLSLGLHAEGWGSSWRTGGRLSAPAVRAFLGLAEHEELLGWLYVGRPVGSSGPVPRPAFDVAGRVGFDDHAGI
jgi:nitroreductase